MSWIADLTDKAENILNKIDQNAATALQVAAGGTTTPLENMRKSLSSSTLSLKSNPSPVKVYLKNNNGNISINDANGTGAKKLKSESRAPNNADITDSKIEWSVGDTSRRGSASSKADSVIDMDVVPPFSSETSQGKGRKIMPLQCLSTPSMSALSPESQELAAFRIALAEISNERDELHLRLSTLNRDVENAGLQQRAQELEELTLRLTEERDQALQELHDSQTARSGYIHSISELESNLAKLQQEYFEVAQKLQIQLRETAQQRQDLQEYRLKAQHALQMKDNLITELKGSSAGNAAVGTSVDTETRLLQMEYDTLKQEQQNMLTENNKLHMQLEQLRSDLAALNQQHAEQLSMLRTHEDALRKELRLERERILAHESEQRMLAQELDSLRQQLSNQMAASATRLQEKEQQLQQLQRSINMTRQAHNKDEALGSLDTRMKALTQALVDKQNAVENITAERNALRIQLEKMQDQLRHPIFDNGNLHSSNAPRNALLSNSTDDAKAQYPLLLRANPFDNRVARRVKRAYSSLDSAGIRLGAFLRRYPLMRVFLLMYVALLHIWVIFVLVSTTPN